MLLKTFIQWWNEIDPYVSFSLAVIGVISFILSFYFFYKAKLVKKVHFTSNSAQVISPSDLPSNITVLYKQQPVTDLTVTKIAFWNSGNITIDKSDVSQSSPVVLGIHEDLVLYDIEITKATHTSNNFELRKDGDNRAILTFDYIDPQEGCIVKLLHSGDGRYSFIGGKIKGVSKYKHTIFFSSRGIEGTIFKYFPFIFLVLTIAGVYFTRMYEIHPFSAGLLVLITCMFAMFLLSQAKIPKHLSKDFESQN